MGSRTIAAATQMRRTATGVAHHYPALYPTALTSAICGKRARIKAGAGLAALLMLALVAAMLSPTGGVALAQSGYDEADAQAIDRMLMCPVCPAQTIDQTEVQQAKQMRAEVRKQLAAGATRSEILDWFRERYGPRIVAEPPRSGINLIAWIVPGVVIILALAGGFLTLRAMRRPGGAPAAADTNTDTAVNAAGKPDNDDLQPWLDAVDRELAQGGRPEPDKDDDNG